MAASYKYLKNLVTGMVMAENDRDIWRQISLDALQFIGMSRRTRIRTTEAYSNIV